MALSEDQRAMLQLLLEGGQSYEDIAGLLGSDADGIRSRARAALTEIGGADPDAQVGLTDFLLGQADPIGRADAARHLQNDPAANELARRLVAQLRLLAPRAALPEIPELRGRGRSAPAPAPTAGQPTAGATLADAPPPPPASAPAAPRGPSAWARMRTGLSGAGEGFGSLSGRQSQIVVGLGAAAILVLAVVLGLTVFSGSDGTGSDTSSVPTGIGQDVTVVPLAALAAGSDASGQAVIAQPNNQGQVQLNLTGLQPSRGSDIYVAWLYNSDRIAFPLGFFRANQQGSFSGPAPIPAQMLSLVRRFGCIDVSQVAGERVVGSLRKAIQTGTLPGHTGTSVVRGEIPEPGQEAASGADSNCRGSLPAGAAGGTGTTGAGSTPP